MNHSIAQIADTLTVVYIASLWQGFVFVVLGYCLCRLFPRASSGFRHSVLMLLFLGALFLPWLHGGTAVASPRTHLFELQPWIASTIAFLWLAAAFYRATQLYLAWRQLKIVRLNAVPVEVRGRSEFSGGARCARLCTSPLVDAPMVLGFRSPRLLLPTWMLSQLSEADLQQIAHHECEHLRRRDDWVNLALQIAIVLSPLNLALLWIDTRIRVQRELAVDEAVVTLTGQPLSYASCLTRLAEQRQKRSRLRLALAAWGRKSELAQRVEALLARPARWTERQTTFAATAIVACFLGIAALMAATPELVRVNQSSAVLATSQTASAITAAEGTAQLIPVSFQESAPETARQAETSPKSVEPSKHPPQFRSRRPKPRAALANPPYNRPRLKEPTVPFIPTRFVSVGLPTDYVAFRTSSGWLLIQL